MSLAHVRRAGIAALSLALASASSAFAQDGSEAERAGDARPRETAPTAPAGTATPAPTEGLGVGTLLAELDAEEGPSHG
jgi:hypothetical protein